MTTQENILNVIISALIYGCCFSFFVEFVIALFYAIKLLFSIFFISHTSDVIGCKNDNCENTPIPLIISNVLIFGIGFMFLSYCFLDGNLRLYPLIISFSSYKMLSHYVTTKVRKRFLGGISNLLRFSRKKLTNIMLHLKNSLNFGKIGKNEQTNEHRPP